MSRTRAVLTATLLASALALGGCSDDDPQPRFAPSESPRATASSSAASPASPGPLEVVRAWVVAQNEALSTGDTTELESVGASHCRTCDQFVDPIKQVHSKGGYFRGGLWTLDAAKVRKSSKPQKVVDAGVTVAGGATKPAAGEKVVRYAAEKHIMTFRLVQEGGRWVITFIGFVS